MALALVRWVPMWGNEGPFFSGEVSEHAPAFFKLARCQTLAGSLLTQIFLKAPRCHEICSLCCITVRLEFERRLSQDGRIYSLCCVTQVMSLLTWL